MIAQRGVQRLAGPLLGRRLTRPVGPPAVGAGGELKDVQHIEYLACLVGRGLGDPRAVAADVEQSRGDIGKRGDDLRAEPFGEPQRLERPQVAVSGELRVLPSGECTREPLRFVGEVGDEPQPARRLGLPLPVRLAVGHRQTRDGDDPFEQDRVVGQPLTLGGRLPPLALHVEGVVQQGVGA